MPFVPHTHEDEKLMLDTIGVDSIEDLFDAILHLLLQGSFPNKFVILHHYR